MLIVMQELSKGKIRVLKSPLIILHIYVCLFLNSIHIVSCSGIKLKV